MLIMLFRNIEPTWGSGLGWTGFWVGGSTNSSSFETWQLSALACTLDPTRQSERKWQQSGPISLRDAGWAGHTHLRDMDPQSGRESSTRSLQASDRWELSVASPGADSNVAKIALGLTNN